MLIGFHLKNDPLVHEKTYLSHTLLRARHGWGDSGDRQRTMNEANRGTQTRVRELTAVHKTSIIFMPSVSKGPDNIR